MHYFRSVKKSYVLLMGLVFILLTEASVSASSGAASNVALPILSGRNQPSYQGETGGALLWSDDFGTGGGPAQTWHVIDNGDNSSALFVNNRYELHTENFALSGDKFVSSYVEGSATDAMIQTRIERINPGDMFLGGVMLRADPDTLDGYAALIGSWSTLYIVKGGAGGGVLNSVTYGFGSIDPAHCRLTFAAMGDTLYAKAWTTGDPEPDDWKLIVSDSDFAMGHGGVFLSTGGSGSYFSPAQVAFDDVSMTTDFSSICSYTLSSSLMQFDAGAGSGSFGVDAVYGVCAWDASTSDPWISIISGSGPGDGAVTYDVSANMDAAPITGTIHIAGETHTVYQAGTGGVDLYSDDFDGGTPDATWVEIDNVGINASAQFVNDRFELSIEDPGGSGAYLTYGVFEIASDCLLKCRIRQIAPGEDFIAAVFLRGNPEAGTGYFLQVNTYGDMISIYKTAGGIGTSTLLSSQSLDYDITDVCVKFAAIGNNLYAKIWQSDDPEPNPWNLAVSDGDYPVGGSAVAVFAGGNVSRAAFDDVSMTTDMSKICSYDLSPPIQSVGNAAGLNSVDVTAYPAGCPACRWEALSNDPWLTVDSGTPGTGDGVVGYSFGSNTAENPRTGTIDIGGELFEVRQGGQALWSENFDNNGTTQHWVQMSSFDPGDSPVYAFASDERFEFNVASLTGPADKHLDACADTISITDGIIQSRYQGISTSFMANLGLRLDPVNDNGYGFGWDGLGHFWIGKRNNGAGEALVVKESTVHDPMNCQVKFAAIGNKFFGKIWTYDTPEPESWQIEFTDDPGSPQYYAQGYAGVGIFAWYINAFYIASCSGAFDDIELYTTDNFWIESETSTGGEIEPGIPETLAVGNSSVEVTSAAAADQYISVVDSNDEPFHKYTGGIFGSDLINKQVLIKSGLADGQHITVVKLHYTDEELGDRNELDLRLLYWSDMYFSRRLAVSGNTTGSISWKGDSPPTTTLGDHGVDTVNNILWAVVDHYSDFGAGPINADGWSFQNSSEMRFGDDTQPESTVLLDAGGSYIWVAEAPVFTDTAYVNAAWKGQLNFEEMIPEADLFEIEVGFSTDGTTASFVAGGPGVTINGDGLARVYAFDTGEDGVLSLSAGRYVALRVTNLSSNTYHLKTGALRSWLNAPGQATDGDVNADGQLDLSDAILTLKVAAGIDPLQDVYTAADVNGDGKIGVEEAIYIIENVTGFRE